MSRVFALVEGQTEQAFVREVLAPALAPKGVFLTGGLMGKPGCKGGVRPWASARREILAALKQDRRRHCTTMFDYYGLPNDWPGAEEAKGAPFALAAGTIEQAILADVSAELEDSSAQCRFVPYIQLHEFEALLFSDTETLANVLHRPDLKGQLHGIVSECAEPEGIDDDPETAPSKRILSIAPAYQKPLHGAIAAKRIGLERMRQACPHFNAWVTRLEALEPEKRT